MRQNEWPPDYVLIKAWREQQTALLENDAELVIAAKQHYASNHIDFINDWCITYDPRLLAKRQSPRVPFILFEQQAHLADFFLTCIKSEESGLVEKSRDMGATWIGCALSVWMWLFWPGTAIGWGSRKEKLVDSLGDPNSIFEKMRIIIKNVPSVFIPDEFSLKTHAHYMRIVNPENGSSIIGEVGDSIGRGGRTLAYFKDESSHYTRAESIEAALMENTRCQLDVSSVSGLGTVFHRRRQAGVEWNPGQQIAKGRTNVFILDWSHHPEKTQQWYDTRKAKARDEGLLHLFAQEIERDYAAAVEGVIIPGDHAKAAIDAHLKLGIEPSGPHRGALDVADEGLDTNVQSIAHGILLEYLEQWSKGDTGKTARKSVGVCSRFVSEGLTLENQYDCIGVGAGVKAEVNRLKEIGKLPKGISFTPWNAAAGVRDPYERVIPKDKESPLNRDFFQNFKAQAWWNVARRFEITYRAITESDYTYDPDDIISISSKLPLLWSLISELSQPVMTRSASTLKLVVKKKPDGAKSPNLGDSFVMNYYPAPAPHKPALALGGIQVLKGRP